MFVYEKKLEYPIRIKNSNPALAKFICSQYGGPDGELGASLRYLSQRYAMPYPELSAVLTDIGTEAAEVVPRRADPLQNGQKKSDIAKKNSSKARNIPKGLTTAEFCITITP